MAEGVEVRESPIHGRGAFATRAYEPGVPILPIDDSPIVTPESPLDPQRVEAAQQR